MSECEGCAAKQQAIVALTAERAELHALFKQIVCRRCRWPFATARPGYHYHAGCWRETFDPGYVPDAPSDWSEWEDAKPPLWRRLWRRLRD